jgi:4-hydroxy-tetrahydrodipicolinate synthase
VTASALPDGVYTVVPTPFARDGALDIPSLERLMKFLAGCGVEGMLVLGVLGEAPKLLPDERRAVIEASVRTAADRRVVVGVTHPSVVGTRTLAHAAAAAGAHALLIAPPRVDRAAGDDTIVDYFAESTEGLDVEVVLQDHPASSGVPLDVELLARIVAAAPAVRSIKLEDPPTPSKVSLIRKRIPELKVFGGLGGVFYLEELRRGANGTMTGFAFPEALVDVFRAYTGGEPERAAELFYRYLPLIRFEFQEAVGLAVRKHVYVLRGLIDDAHVRAPSAPLDAASLDDLHELLAHLELDPGGARRVDTAA